MAPNSFKPLFRTFLVSASLLVPAAVSMFTVRLRKQIVPVILNNRRVVHKSAFFGPVYAGYPTAQNFTVVFDTGSAHFFLPSSKCEDEPCLHHNRYDSQLSGSAVHIDHDGVDVAEDDPERGQVSLAYGTGEVAGEFVNEIVCLGSPAAGAGGVGQPNCARTRLILAQEMTAQPFESFNFDGVLGLGLEALALHPEFNFFGQLTGAGEIVPTFGVFIARNETSASEITFGGHNPARLAGPLHWAPVIFPEQGYWQVKINAVKVGTEELDLCEDGGCTAILDTGTSLLGVPQAGVQTINWMLARRVKDNRPDIDCRETPGPTLSFDLGEFSLELDASDYTRAAAMQYKDPRQENSEVQIICRASLFPVDLAAIGPKVFLMGEPLLRRYYTAYDTHRLQMGFAIARQPKDHSDLQPVEFQV